MSIKTITIAIILIVLTVSLQKRTRQSITESFKRFDNNADNILSKSQIKLFFDRDYMVDFAGINIDQKFIDSAFNAIVNSDKNGNGLQLDQFIEAILPDQQIPRKRQPEYYAEQQL